MSAEIHRLSNGFRVVTEVMPGFESASLGIWVLAGARHERAAQNGIAHFLEHMAFKGTTKRSPQQIAEEIENVGGYLNAYTSREVTAYYARVLKDDTALALDVIADIVLNSAFDPRELEVERGVILSEIGQALDTPDDVIFDWLQEASYPSQAMGRTILGPPERVQNFTREDLAQFVAEHYTPENMILSAAGGIDPEALLKDAERLFGGLAASSATKAEGAVFSGGEMRQDKALEQAHFTLAFEAPSYKDEDVYVAQTASTALGGGMSSRLFQEVREKHGLCYSIYAQTGSYMDTGLTTIYAGTSGEDIAQLAQLTARELTRAAEDVSADEVDRARAQIKSGLVMGLESPSSRAERNARMVGIWDGLPPLSETVARLDAVDEKAVRAHLGAMTAAPMSQALYGPISDAPDRAQMQAWLQNGAG